MTRELKSLYVFEVEKEALTTPLPCKKKIKKEKIEMITNHNPQTRINELEPTTITGQHLQQIVLCEPVYDEDEESDVEYNVLGETRCNESSSDGATTSSDDDVDLTLDLGQPKTFVRQNMIAVQRCSC